MSWRADISRNVNALRIFFDASNARAAGLRSFVEKNFAELKALNPETPVLVRLREGAPTQVWAKYDLREEVRELDGATEEQVEAAFRDLVIRGASEPRGAPGHSGVEYVIEGGTDGLTSGDPWANLFMSKDRV